MNILSLETSTQWCSLAVCRGDQIWTVSLPQSQKQGETLLDSVQDLLREARLSIPSLQGIALGKGPGAFTGIRMACGMAQGLALARAIPVVGVDSLVSTAHAMRQAGGERFVVCLDARMGEVYHAAYERDSAVDIWRVLSEPALYDPGSVPSLDGTGWIACGTGFAAHREVLLQRLGGVGSVTAIYPEAVPTARAILELARPRFAAGLGEDAASALPLYLRDKVALTRQERAAGQRIPAIKGFSKDASAVPSR